MSTVTVRPYRAGDRGAVLELGRRLTEGMASWRDPGAAAVAVQGWVETSLGRLEFDDQAVLVAVADTDGAVVGFVTVTERSHYTGEREGYIGELAVAQERARDGVGRALLTAAEAWVGDRGLGRVSLDTGAANAPARAFYRAAGYDEEDVRLTRALPSPPP